MKKMLLIVGDGMCDREVDELNNKTPLEYANTPNMDYLARMGVCGLRPPYELGVAVESDVANLTLLGYDPAENYLGRGVFEALGVGVKLNPGDLALRVNLATVRNGLIVDRRAGRFDWDKGEIVEELNKIRVEGVKTEFYPGIEHRGVLVFRGRSFSRMVSGNDPHSINVPPLEIRALSSDSNSTRTALILKRYVEEAARVLSNLEVNKLREEKGLLPANYLLVRGPGVYREIEGFEEKYGLRGCIVCGIPLVRGVGVAVGLNPVRVEGATGGVNTNYLGKAEAAVKCLEEYDFTYLHFKAPDTASHDGDFELKVKVIERIDEAIGRVIDLARIDELTIALTADHATPLVVREHTGDPVPFLIYSKGIVRDSVASFSERSVLKGGLKLIGSMSLINLLINYSRKPKYLQF